MSRKEIVQAVIVRPQILKICGVFNLLTIGNVFIWGFHPIFFFVSTCVWTFIGSIWDLKYMPPLPFQD